MKTLRSLLRIAALLFTATGASAQVVINEFDADQSGSSDGTEFIELLGAPGTSLDGLIVVLFNGSDNQSYDVIDLAGHSTDSNGLFLIGTTGMTGAGIEIAPGGFGWLQNGADAIAVYQDLASNFPNDTPPTSTNLIDAIVYGTADATDFDLIDVLTPGKAQLDENGNGNKDTESNQRQPDGGSAFDPARFTLGAPSPGAPNNPPAELGIFFSASSVAEDAGAGGAITATVVHDADPNQPVTVTITNGDPTELQMPADVVVPGDGTGQATFTITPVDDGAADGTVTVTVGVTSPGIAPAEGTIDVTDDGDSATLVVNEVNAEVEDGRDANKNGITDHQGDEFVELVNVSGAPLDISGWTIEESDGVAHTFPSGTVLGDGCAAVVFGGGIPVEGRLAAFGNALVQNASTGALNLNNTGDSIFVRQGAVERAGFAFGDIEGADGSQTRDPDLTGPFIGHIAAAAGSPFSPGTRTGGSPFCSVIDSLTVTVTPATISETDGAAAASGEVARSGDTTDALEVALVSTDTSEASVPATVTISAGSATATFPIDAVDDSFVDGDQTVTIAAGAGPGFVVGTDQVTVGDAGGDTGYILINEVEVNPPGSDTAEFIELYDGGAGNTPLDGYAVVLFNGTNGTGSDDTAYDQFDLDGFSTDAEGYFVIGSIGVANAGIDVFPIPGGWIVNSGTRAVALYSAEASTFPIGTSPTGTGIVDAVIYGSDAEAANLAAALGTPTAVLARDGETDTISRLPDGAGGRLAFSGFGDGLPTPGATNQAVGAASAYDLWAAGFPGLGGPGDDDDCDGIPNAIEFALGLNPQQPDGGALPQPFINGGGNLQITVDKAAAASGAAFFASTSFDAVDWSNTDLNVITDSATTFAAEYTGSAPVALLRWGVNVSP